MRDPSQDFVPKVERAGDGSEGNAFPYLTNQVRLLELNKNIKKM